MHHFIDRSISQLFTRSFLVMQEHGWPGFQFVPFLRCHFQTCLALVPSPSPVSWWYVPQNGGGGMRGRRQPPPSRGRHRPDPAHHQSAGDPPAGGLREPRQPTGMAAVRGVAAVSPSPEPLSQPRHLAPLLRCSPPPPPRRYGVSIS